MKMKTIKIFDTTLRDGEQSPGCSMNLAEKIAVAKQLEALKVDVIEAGFAISSPGDFESVQAIANEVKTAAVASLNRAVKKDIDASYEALKGAVAPRIHIFLATSPLHMEYKLKMSEEQVLEKIKESISYACTLLPDVEFSAEDAFRSDRPFLAKAVKAAIDAGAKTVNIPDTVGYALPAEMGELISYLKQNVEGIDDIDISVHCHNDLGMAVGNSLASVAAGATQVECTVNGIGERAGNASLEEVVMAIHTRRNLFDADTNIDSKQIYRTSRLLSKTIGVSIPPNKAIVGANAFAHESGIHQHGVLAKRETYEIMTPESVGLTTNKMVLGKHSGRHAFEDFLKELGYNLGKDELDTAFAQFKDLCDKKKEVTEYDIEALVSDKTAKVTEHYKLKQFVVNSGNAFRATASILLEDMDGKEQAQVAFGDGPVDAAYQAIEKIVPVDTTLQSYKINAVSHGEDALGEVIVKVSAGDKTVTGRGLSTDIIESSILAYINGINKLLG
ncbi:2-isopropylmalate synthase [Christensenellaceae bacterium OttesenSCG-928-K19]|nr:2-isopropylmalate synthase [Christensenellaceae bacterium OttesenSCG-928-K19]